MSRLLDLRCLSGLGKFLFMDSLSVEDLKNLEYDVNTCTVREFCDVFSIDASTANNIQEYRAEILYILKLDQLLKLKGISPESLRNWENPKPTQEVNAELQKSLGFQTASQESIPNLMEAACRRTGGAACLISARNGMVLAKALVEGTPFENIAPEIPEWLRPVYDNLLQMKQGCADMQVMGFESGDYIFQPVSGFYLVSMQPPGKLDQDALKLWRSLANEIRRRYPPRIFIEKHAVVTTSDIAFDCPECHLRIVVDQAGAGATIPCPRCKTQVTVPSKTTSHSSYLTPDQAAGIKR